MRTIRNMGWILVRDWNRDHGPRHGIRCATINWRLQDCEETARRLQKIYSAVYTAACRVYPHFVHTVPLYLLCPAVVSHWFSLWYGLEPPSRAASVSYPSHVFWFWLFDFFIVMLIWTRLTFGSDPDSHPLYPPCMLTVNHWQSLTDNHSPQLITDNQYCSVHY